MLRNQCSEIPNTFKGTGYWFGLNWKKRDYIWGIFSQETNYVKANKDAEIDRKSKGNNEKTLKRLKNQGKLVNRPLIQSHFIINFELAPIIRISSIELT